MLKIAIYGKGGIGKSTISSNLSAIISKSGKKVLHVGCDPKGDSTRNLMGRKIPTVISILKEKDNLNREDIIYKGFNGIECVETGGPEAGIGCAGRGIITTMEELEDLKVFDEDRDVIIYDVLGDVVCGGFAVPMREKYADIIYIVTSSEFMSIFAANNIMKSIKNFSKMKNIKFGGLIHNQRNNNSSINILKIFADMTKSKIIGEIPFSKTIAEMYPNSDLCNNFLELSEKILSNQDDLTFSPLSEEEMEYLAAEILKENIYYEEE